MAELPVTGDGDPRELLPGFDISVAHPARVYDYWLGGKDHFEPDRIVAEEVIAVRPTIIRDIRANRAFLGRAVRFLASEAGIRQFLDIGTGLPTSPNVHEVAQSAAPESRIVYVDNDPIVLAHARALLTSTPEGACAYLDADLKDTGKILQEAARTWVSLRHSALKACRFGYRILVAVNGGFLSWQAGCGCTLRVRGDLPASGTPNGTAAARPSRSAFKGGERPGSGRLRVTTPGFPWLAVAGKTLTDWLVIDMDATLVTASSTRKERLRRGRKATASPRSERGSPTRASAWPCCSAPATPARTPSPTTRRCWPGP